MKKFIFAFFVLPLAVFVVTAFSACINTLSEKNTDDDPASTNVVYDDKWKFVTLYLDDTLIGVSGKQASRAMTVDSARRGFDYFEVVFYYGSQQIAEASWELGRRALIKVPMSGDYSAVNVQSGKGCAVLFAGRKEDRTLLAVGRLVNVDDVETAVISDSSSSVTFELFTLTGGVSQDAAKSSFTLTSAETRITSALFGTPGNAAYKNRYFPLYILPVGNVDAQYQFKFKQEGSWDSNDPDFYSLFKNTIVLAEPNSTFTLKREVRFPGGSGKYWYPKYPQDSETKVTMTNNKTAGEVFQNPVTFSFDTSSSNNPNIEDNGLFALTFEIPVYPAAKPAGSNVQPWYIRTGYMSYNYNIDNGITDNSLNDINIGGAVLLGVNAPVNFEIPAERR